MDEGSRGGVEEFTPDIGNMLAQFCPRKTETCMTQTWRTPTLVDTQLLNAAVRWEELKFRKRLAEKEENPE